MYYAIVAKDNREDATYYERPEQKAARERLKDMNGLTFATLEEAEEYLDIRGVVKEEGWAYPQTGIAAPGASMIWFLRLRNPGYRIGASFQLCKCNGKRPEDRYSGTHPANIAADLRDIAKDIQPITPGNSKRLRDYADDIERLGKAAGVKFL